MDFFSLAFGLCGVSGVDCDLNSKQRAQLSEFFHSELQTSDWIRATSPACNCNNSHPVPDTAAGLPETQLPSVEESNGGEEWPALTTCKADR